jgi:ABC-type nitrate/sulfonate/bicarbonate transport system ATPase subunit
MLYGELLDVWAETEETVLFVTHDVEEAVRLGGRVVEMAANPVHVREVVSVDLNRPRRRTSPAFAESVERFGISSAADRPVPDRVRRPVAPLDTHRTPRASLCC